MIDFVPELLRGSFEALWDSYVENSIAAGHALPQFDDHLVHAWVGSEFVARACIKDPDLVDRLFTSGDLERVYEETEYQSRLSEQVQHCGNPDELSTVLRTFRRNEMVRIAWRDLAGEADLEEVLVSLSRLADACVSAALSTLYDWQVSELGEPVDDQGRPQELVVLGMGKLGARELNFSSDIDLIFAYPADGEVNGRKAKTNEEFFVRLGRRLIKVLNEHTADGFVFRVDMRLRPFGDSGPLAMSFAQMETYYTTQGREWERYAMIKARPVAGDIAAGQQLMAMLKPFVYRRYLDYGTFEQLREMKAMIAREVSRRGLRDNIKLGPGGIREVEFIGQAFQLVRGGRESRLQHRGILVTLEALADLGHISRDTFQELKDAYIFLRKTENRLQAFADQQSQTLPTDEIGRARLAFTMAFPDWHSFNAALAKHQNNVQRHFQAVFGEDVPDNTSNSPLDHVWADHCGDEKAIAILASEGVDDPAVVAAHLRGLRESRTYRALTSVARERLDRLIPRLLQNVRELPDGSVALVRLLDLMERIAGRSVYLSLLLDSPKVLGHLVRLVDASPWLASYVTRHPIVLDELLDPRRLYGTVERHDLKIDLASRLEVCTPRDTECEMDALRHCKHAHVLRVAAADIMGVTPLMKVSDLLTDIAEACVSTVLELSLRDITMKHGRPSCTESGVSRHPGLGVIAYGKLGGWELGYGSDLDVVLIHNSTGERQESEGDRPLDNNTWFARVAQRMVNYLATSTSAGQLYEIDMRLRPNGNSGMLVTGLNAFVTYQRDAAWTWEHQALVRARFIAGDPKLKDSFDEIRHEILSRKRDTNALRTEVRDMRARMREQLGSRSEDEFDLKQDAGGIADIEFLVQFAVLSQANAHPALTRWTDNIRILETLATEGLMSAEDADLLADAYRAYRARGHRLVLQDKPARVPADEFIEFRSAVQGLWNQWMGNGDN
ncbi:MAG: bifunctional [glutamate--ammonia ligase]-adenylyl-L-tyrosine phosphorylase/[glutamate--ammonia-ligase] adenylyltransferase [Gammaproteobacteria bacterium]|nr:bifunctional [glutamate--ammonia ligase]-adenylyl-L-tyrosine phosphorylase/[glutamate--ammonia-ligase] adenylyltransferase [Gammaproteobacteria bacterium]MCP5137591.1 bifunctional [glutamate--ammonia ligase]-adenylyl-L-tyrosine phosphorylase/[glutamate--ammonia-ligase] adenylyltransferase [Gammaproteobacteria bacterium]